MNSRPWAPLFLCLVVDASCALECLALLGPVRVPERCLTILRTPCEVRRASPSHDSLASILSSVAWARIDGQLHDYSVEARPCKVALEFFRPPCPMRPPCRCTARVYHLGMATPTSIVRGSKRSRSAVFDPPWGSDGMIPPNSARSLNLFWLQILYETPTA